MFNSEELKGKWLEVKGDITKKWGELTDDDLERTKGNFNSLVGVVVQKMGLKTEEVSQQLKDIAARYLVKAESATKDVADKANQTIDRTKDKLKNQN